MRWITGTNKGYLDKMYPYLASLKENCALPVSFVTVGFEANAGAESDWLYPIAITHEQNAGAPPETECIQHGSFLNVIDGPDDEALVYTDGDMIMQRPISDDEMRLLGMLPDGAVLASWNSGPDEALLHEASRLRPKVALEQITHDWGELVQTHHCFNVGVLIARRSTWQLIYNFYMANWERVGQYFWHQARQQWLISYAIAALGITAYILPYSFHSHGHYGPPPDFSIRDGLAYTGEDAILLRHKL